MLDFEGKCTPWDDSSWGDLLPLSETCVCTVDGRIGVMQPFVSYLCIGGCISLRTGEGEQLGVGRPPTETFQSIGSAKRIGSLLAFSSTCLYWPSLSAGTRYGNVEN